MGRTYSSYDTILFPSTHLEYELGSGVSPSAGGVSWVQVQIQQGEAEFDLDKLIS